MNGKRGGFCRLVKTSRGLLLGLESFKCLLIDKRLNDDEGREVL